MGGSLGRAGVLSWAKWKCEDAGTKAEHQNEHFRYSVIWSVFFWSVHFSVPPFLSPWLLSPLLFHSLSLSLSCFLFFSFLPFLFFLSFLVFLCSFLPCFFTFVSRKKISNITFERLLFIKYFCFRGFPLLLCLSNPFSYFCFFRSFSRVFWST